MPVAFHRSPAFKWAILVATTAIGVSATLVGLWVPGARPVTSTVIWLVTIAQMLIALVFVYRSHLLRATAEGDEIDRAIQLRQDAGLYLWICAACCTVLAVGAPG